MPVSIELIFIVCCFCVVLLYYLGLLTPEATDVAAAVVTSVPKKRLVTKKRLDQHELTQRINRRMATQH
jgi:hypothetical protein